MKRKKMLTIYLDLHTNQLHYPSYLQTTIVQATYVIIHTNTCEMMIF